MALDYYMKKFREIYPSGPRIMEVFQLYENALEGIPDIDRDAACERALKECRFFPTPAELLALCPKNDFLVTTTAYDERPLSEDDKKPFLEGMAVIQKQLGVRPQIVRAKNTQPFPRSETNFTAMVGSQTLQQWAANQTVSDDLPRSSQEIELIRTIIDYGKPKKKRRGRHEQRAI
jgi:hypothetical protein